MSDIQIIPLVWDPVQSALSILDGIKTIPLLFIIRKIIPIYGLIYSFLKSKRRNKYYEKSIGKSISNYALGYVIIAKKK